MIRVAVILVAIAQMSLVAVAEEPATTAPSKPVMDSYYARRQQKKTAAAELNPQSAVSNESSPMMGPYAGQSMGPSLGFTPAAAGSDGLIDPQAAMMPQAAAMPANAYAAGMHQTGAQPYLMHYANTNQDSYSGDEEVATPEQSYSDDGNGEYCEEPCDDQASGPGMSCFMAAVRSVPTTNVLWNEIYSCRSMWADFDYLGFWVKGNHVPPLVTTSPIGTPQSQAGVLGQPGTSILFGDQRLNTDMRSGGRITFGAWLVGDVLAVEGNYYALGTETTNYNAVSVFSNGSTTDPILARPYFNPAPPTLTPPPPHLPAQPPAQSAELVAFSEFRRAGRRFEQSQR